MPISVSFLCSFTTELKVIFFFSENLPSPFYRYSQNIQLLREQVDHTQKQVASLEGEPQKVDPLREEQVRELQGQLETLRAKMHRMETLERSFSETKRKLEVRVFSVSSEKEHAKTNYGYMPSCCESIPAHVDDTYRELL